jgi:type I restriction enzyme S subunit
VKAGWKTKSLGEILLKTETVNPAATPDDDFEYIDVSSVSNETYEIEETQQLKGKDAPSRARRLVKAGDVIFATIRPTLQRIARVPASLDGQVCSTGYFVMRPYPELDAQYLFYSLFTQQFMSGMESLQKGASYPAVTDAEVRSQQISYPTLQEQHRIVTLLDEAFADIATAKANAEKNLHNAEVLFQSQLQALFNRPSSGRVQTTLGKATGGIFTGPFGSLLHKHDYVENGIPLVNPAHISPFGIEPDYRKTVSNETASRLANYIMRVGDIVIGRRGEMGRCALITDVEDGWLCGTGSFFIKPSNRCDAAYLVHLLRSEGCKQQLEKIAGGAVMPNLSNTDLSNFVVELPSIDEQKRIVFQIELAGQDIEKLKSIYRQKLTALDDLKKSLLHQAFSGQL